MHDDFDMNKQLTCVCVCECCHKLQVLLHKCSLVHHSGTRGRHKGHGGSRARRCFKSEKGQTGVCCTGISVISCVQMKLYLKKIFFYFEHLFNGCYFDALTANINMPHYRRIVMTSFKDAGVNFFLKSYRLGDWKWTYRENSNLIKTS